MHDLKKIAGGCIDEMKMVNIPIKDSAISDVKSGNINSFGLCVDDGHYRNFTIIIRKDLIQDTCPLTELKQVIIHELIHTCPRCWSHGKTWKKYAMIMNNAYGYSLLEGRDDDSIFHKEKPILHKYECPKCNSRYDSRVNRSSYRCPFCNSYYKEKP